MEIAKGTPTPSSSPIESSAESIEIMNALLADHWVILVKSLNYHWNVEGIQFGELHKLLETVYQDVFEHIDEIAERVRAMGGRPLGTLHEISETAKLTEATGTKRSPNEMLQDLLHDLESLNRSLREGATRCEEHEDFGSTDLLTGLIRENEKQAWMLRASIQQ